MEQVHKQNKITQNLRMVEVGTCFSWSALQTHAQDKVILRSLLRTVFGQIFNISGDGDFITPLNNVFQYLITFKLLFFSFQWILLYFILCSLSLVFSLGTTEKTLALSSSVYPIYTEKTSSQPSLIVQLVFLEDPSCLFCKTAFLEGERALILPRGGTGHLLSLSFIKCLSAYFSSRLRSM